MRRSALSPIPLALALALGGCVPGILDPIITGGISGQSSESTDALMTSSGTSSTGDPDPGSTTSASITSAGASTGDPDPGSSDSGAIFITPPDPPAECDPWVQDCAEGEKCSAEGPSPITSGSIACMPIVPEPDQLGEPCEVLVEGHLGPDTCDIWLFCHDVDPDTGKGTCISLCNGYPEAPICAPGFTCAQSDLPLCIPECDPLLQGCPAGEMCWPFGTGFGCWPAQTPSTQGLFEVCENITDCEPGLACVDPASAVECDLQAIGCCTPYCDLGGPNTCPAVGQECVPYEPGDGPSELEHLGFCALP